MKKKLYQLIRSNGYNPSYSGKTGILHISPCTQMTAKCNITELREKINDFMETNTTSKDDVFFDEIKFN